MKKSKKILLGAMAALAIMIGIGASVISISSNASCVSNEVQTVNREITKKMHILQHLVSITIH